MRCGVFVFFGLSVLFVGCKACVTLDQPLQFPCNPDSGTPGAECPSDFRCGLEGRCHALDAGAAYPCRTSADCEGDWRCGLDGVCHELDAGAPYLCTSDTDCEAQWRCGPLGHCVDARADGLELPDAGFSPLTVAPLIPNVPGPSAPIGASPTLQLLLGSDAGCSYTDFLQSTSWVNGVTLTKHMSFDSAVARIPEDTPEGPACEAAQQAAGFTGITAMELQATVSDVVALADDPLNTWTLASDGTVCQLTLDPKSLNALPLQCQMPFSGGIPTHLRPASGESGLVAWNDTQLWWTPDLNTPAKGPFSTSSPDGGTAHFLDVVSTYDDGYPGYRALMAIGPEALYVGRLNDGGTVVSGSGSTMPPFSEELTSQLASANGPDRVLLQRGDATWVLAGGAAYPYHPNAGNTPNIIIDFGVHELSVVGIPLLTCEEVDSSRITNAMSASTYAFNNQIGVLSRCVPVLSNLVGHQAIAISQVDQTSQVGLWITNSKDIDFSPPALFFAAQTRAGTGNPSTTVWADDLGHVWTVEDVNSSQTSVAIVPHLPDAPFDFVGGDSALIEAGTLPQQWLVLAQKGLSTDFIDSAKWSVSPDGGFDEGFRSPSVTRVGQVRGIHHGDVFQIPEDIFMASVAVSSGNLATFIASSDDPNTVLAPLDITSVRRGGTQYLVWRSFDTVWLGTLDPSIDAGYLNFYEAPSPERRLTPLLGQAITSMAWADETDGGFLDGYLVAGPRLFSFTAINSRVWRSDEVIVGQDEPVEVFFDRGRARVALRDGSVWSLPSRVQLAPPFDSSVGLAQGFGTVCQNILALAAGGLYRLQWSAGDSVGTWQKVTLPASVAAASPDANSPDKAFAKSRLISIDHDVLLQHSNGVAFRLSYEVCP
jgi:hypothetical protein